MAAKDLLSSGIIWRVGDGKSINVWGDNWLPNFGSLNFQPELTLPRDAKVSDLIDVSVRGWNCGLIDNCFPAYVANIIKNIPLCPLFPPDKIIWNGTSSRSFSVKNAYHMALDLLKQKNGECSYSVGNRDFWKKIWSTNVSNVSKKFLWRACQNALPTKQNLFRKGVVENDICTCCQLEGESVVHALWCCPGAQDVWGCGPVFCQKSPSFFPDMVDLVSYLLSNLTANLMSLSVVVLHRIWLRRNKLIFEGQFVPPLKVCLETSHLLEDFKKCNLRKPLSTASSADSSFSRKFWEPHVAGFVKINWDASLNVSSALVGMGFVIRDADGFVVAAKCGITRDVAEPVCTEAMAALFALEFCCDLGYVNVVSEGDSLQIIKAVCDSDYPLHKIGHFLEAIKQKAGGFSVCNWSHCARDANEVAHLLARRASSYGLCNVWTETLPLFISSACFRDFLVSRL
jgi:hypothetical protein